MPEYDHEHFYHSLLTALDAPVNERNLIALRAWQECEGSSARFNPLDTTQPEPGDDPYNSFDAGGITLHVWNYPTEEEGVQATVTTLHNGHYPTILAALREGTGRIVHGSARDEMHTWGSNPDCIASKLEGTAVTQPQDKPQDAPQEAPQEQPRVPFGHDMRDWLNRTLRHLQTREHGLPEHDAHLLREVAREAQRVVKIK